jgi:hypothetical protein
VGDKETEVKHPYLLFILFAACPSLFCQEEAILAEKEKICMLMIGDGQNAIQYHYTEEGFYSPSGPMVTNSSELVFLPTYARNSMIIYKDGVLKIKHIAEGFPSWTGSNYFFCSQEGMSTISTYQILYSKGNFWFYDHAPKSLGYSPDYTTMNYPMPWGALLYSETSKNGAAIVFNLNNPSAVYKIIDQAHFKNWLMNQPGGFSIGSDGFLYRNGMLFSAIQPTSWESEARTVRYIGRLMSGHVIWADLGIPSMERRFTVTAPNGKVELEFILPWALDYGKANSYNPFNYGIGPWGELYCLIAPKLSTDDSIPWPPAGSSSELVVIRNYLKYFGRLNDGNVRLRKDPSTSADVLGTYPAKTGFRIIEKGKKQETIGGKTDYWYHVRLLDGKEGWFFGSFVANLYDGPGTPPPWPNVADW